MAKGRRGLLDFDDEVLAEAPAMGSDGAETSSPHQEAHPRRAGAVRDMADSIHLLQQDANEKEKLLDLIRQGEVIVSIDPDLCDPSPVRDRLDYDVSDLIPSIRDQGQKVPILVRPHPRHEGRYEIAFGNRRAQVCQGLSMPVKAIVRDMSDEEMAIAQGQENTARQDLSYIEQARFVTMLKQKHPTSVVVAAINAEETTVYKMLAIVARIPDELIVLIGKAPKIGRPRWEKLSIAMENPDSFQIALAAASTAKAGGKPSDARFEAAFDAVVQRDKRVNADIMTEGGRIIASRRSSAKGESLVIKETAFLEHLLQGLPRLYEAYLASVAAGSEPPMAESERKQAA